MRNSFLSIINGLKSDKNLAYASYLLAFSFALWPFMVSLSFILFAFLCLFHLRRPLHVEVNFSHVVLLGALFVLYIIGLAITPTLDRGLVLVERISPIFLVPVLLYFSSIHLILNYNRLKSTFIFGVLVSCSISVIVAIFNVITTGDFNTLFYYELAAFFHLHPTHYALFVLTAIHFLIHHTNSYLVKFRTGILLFFIAFILFLQVKIAVIGLFLYLLFYVFIYNGSVLNRKKLIFPFLLLIILFSIGTQLDNNRINEIFKKRTSIEIGNTNEDGVSQRLWLWNEAYRQLKEKPLLGYGLGSQNSIFKWEAEKYNLENVESHEYSAAIKQIAQLNLHNQYIQTIYELGIIAGLVYILSILILLIIGFKFKRTDFIVIFLFFLLFQLSENLLERQMGIYFYAFIIALLFFEHRSLADNKKCIKHQ